jgi:prepilin-type N-terminal cleavage/methylation domain-containing protein
MIRINKEKNEKGFTLIELIVSMGILLLLLGSLSAIFVSAMQTHRRNIAYQELLNQSSYLMEYASRAVRMAQKDVDSSCTGTANSNYNLSDGVLKFKNYEGDCQEFSRGSNEGVSKLKETKKGIVSYLTSKNLNVERFDIMPDDGDSWSQNDNKQPRVTIFLDIKGKENTEIKLQTTISQRQLDEQI